MQDHKLLQTPLLPVFSKFFIKGTATVGSCCLTFALGPLENHGFFSKKFIYMPGSLRYVSQSTVLILKKGVLPEKRTRRKCNEYTPEIQGLRIFCYNLGQKELRILHFSYIQNAYPADLVLLWPIRSPHPTLVKVVQSRSAIIHAGLNIVFWEEEGVFVVASTFKSFTFKLDMVTSIFHNIFVQDCRIPGFNSVYRYETGANLVSYHLPQLHLQFCCSLLHRVSSPYRSTGCHYDSTTTKYI